MLYRMSSTVRTIWKRMKSKEYRESFVASHVSNTIAAQIFMMREDREWTQTILAEKAGMKQSRISAIEDPDFENVEIATLRRLASAFDVGLSVRFVTFSEIAVHAGNIETQDLCVVDFRHDALPISEQKSLSPIIVPGKWPGSITMPGADLNQVLSPRSGGTNASIGAQSGAVSQATPAQPALSMELNEDDRIQNGAEYPVVGAIPSLSVNIQ
jgi:transcriptional regulator with XRE-family HTH domain